MSSERSLTQHESEVPDSEVPISERPERRHSNDRRRYNRRQLGVVAPPYFEVFERIASALEGIEQHLRNRSE